MRRADLIKIFGSAKLAAEFFGLTRAAVYQWGDVVPQLREYEIKARRKEIAEFMKRKRQEALKRCSNPSNW